MKSVASALRIGEEEELDDVMEGEMVRKEVARAIPISPGQIALVKD